MRNAVFGKTMENVRKHRHIKLITTERRRNYLVPEPNHHNNPVYQGLSISDLSKTVMYEFCMILENQNMVKIQNFVI